mmetsp:Transcript_15363/g.19485  ORF Transcript_15363/g.19485 Transcript_15363/m.19485 type:complete len:364 (-) Transcript_15363:178-1269(-)
MTMESLKKAYIAVLFLVVVVSSIIVVQYDLTLNINIAKRSSNVDDAVLTPRTVVMPAPSNSTESTTEPILDIEALSNNERSRSTQLMAATPTTSKSYSILPKKVYSVIGMESSGTQFVTSIIRDALGLSAYREGSFGFGKSSNERSSVQVQHFSLPWGSTCQASPRVPVLDVVLPSQCSKIGGHHECGQMAQDLWGFSNNKVKYPNRYNLNIVSHKEAMSFWGVEQYFIIVVRDQTMSRRARKMHCNRQDLLMKEEEVAREIIIEAINKYILETDKTGKQVTPYNFDFWNARTFQFRRRLGTSSRRKLLSPNSIPMGNNVVLVSYESLILLKEPYIKMLYEALGIKSNYMPTIKDGNSKYVGN